MAGLDQEKSNVTLPHLNCHSLLVLVVPSLWLEEEWPDLDFSPPEANRK